MAPNLTSNPEAIINSIVSSSGRKEEEIRTMIGAKKEKFSGLLTDAGAAFMIAKELGVKLESQSEATKIASLKDGMNNIDVVAKIKNVFAPKTFEKNGKQGKLVSVMLEDDTGEIRATLWNKEADTFLEKSIEAGEKVKATNCAVTSWNGKKQLNLNYNSSLEAMAGEAFEVKGPGITELESNMDNVNVRVKIKKSFPAKEFETDRGKGKVMNFYISQGVDEIRATAWNEQCDEVEKFAEGEFVKIEGAYTKEGQNGVELHLGWKARILRDKKAETNN